MLLKQERPPCVILLLCIRVVVLVIVLVAGRHRPGVATSDDVLLGAPVVAARPTIALELGPPLHGDLAAVELALVFETRLLRLLACCLPGITPGEVVEFPEGIRGQDKVPDGQRDEVDKHPHDVRP